jgi:outer membrane protein TolC
MKIYSVLLILPSLCLQPSAGHAGPDPQAERILITPAYVDQLLEEARAHNPGLRASGARAESASAAVGSVRTWEDPVASIGLWGSTPRGMPASSEGNILYGIDQKLPLYGRPALARKVADLDASRERLEADSDSLRMRRDLETALDDLALAEREAEVSRGEVAWVDETLSDVDHLYRAGKASQVDWLTVQTERAVAGDQLRTRERAREHSALALNRLLNRDLHAPWPPVTIPELEPALFYTEKLVDAALAAEPDLRVLRQESASAEAAAEVTRRGRLPDVSVGVQARQYTGDGGFREGTLMVSFSVPWLNRGRYDSDLRRDRIRKEASDLAASDHSLSVREELHHHIVELDMDRRQALLDRDQLLPLAEQTLASAREAWVRGIGPFRDVIDAERSLLEDRLELARSISAQNSMIADIKLLTGTRDIADLVALAGDASSEIGNHHNQASQ